ncbi:MAG: CBS domain-containing protein, partial [Bacteroidetes bacterium]
SSIMTTDLITVSPEDTLLTVKEIFDNHNIHHVPVVQFKKIVGIVSKIDFANFLLGLTADTDETEEKKLRLENCRVKEIMTKGLAKIDSTEPIRTVLGLFKMNRFHALPIVDKGELVGIVTTFDIINKLAEEPIKLEDYKTAKG